MPMYFIGLTQLTSPSLLGSLRFSSSRFRPGLPRCRQCGSCARGVERQVARHLGAAWIGREGGAETRTVDPLEPHGRIIDQRGFVECQMRAVGQLHGDRRVRGGHAVDRGLLIDLFIAVPFAARNPPGRAVLRQVELGQLVGDLHRRHRRLRGQLIAQAETIVEQAEAHVHLAPAPFGHLLELDQQFGVVVGDEAALAPGLFPGGGLGAGGFAAHDVVAAHHGGAIGEDEAERGGADQQLALAREAVGGAAIAVDRHGQHQAAIGRGKRDGASWVCWASAGSGAQASVSASGAARRFSKDMAGFMGVRSSLRQSGLQSRAGIPGLRHFGHQHGAFLRHVLRPGDGLVAHVDQHQQ
jgi:hypothetical protein